MGRARIESLQAGLAAAAGPGTTDLVVPVSGSVPAWLGDLVHGAAAADGEVRVLIEAEPPADLEGAALDGWEIGVCTAAVAAGVDDVLGVDPQRVTRVRQVGVLLAAHAPQPAPELTP